MHNNRYDSNNTHTLNKKYSTSLLAVILLSSVAGLSLRVAYDNTHIAKVTQNNTPVVEVQNEPQASPTLVILTPPPELRIKSGSGSSMEEITGTGSLIEEDNLSDSTMCGAIDNDRNGLVEMTDFGDFKRSYFQECLDGDIVYIDKCGSKDFDHNQRIEISDFVNFMNKYKIGSCK